MIDNEYYYLTNENLVALINITNCHMSCSLDYCEISFIIDQPFVNADLSGLFKIKDIIGKNGDDIPMLRIKLIDFLMLIQKQKDSGIKHNEVIKDIGDTICQNVSGHYTITQLSEMFRFNATTLKAAFKNNFGCSVYC